MPSKPLRIAGNEFGTIGSAVEHCCHILNKCEIGSTLEGRDVEFVDQILLNRPDKLQEIGERSVVKFECRYRDGVENWTRCFWAILDDGTAIDFSFMKAIRNITDAQHPG